MKIAIATNIFPTLSETFIMNHIISALQNGHAVRIISLKRPQGSVVHEEVEEFKLNKNVFYMPDLPKGRHERLFLAFRIIFRTIWINPKAVFRCFDLRNNDLYKCINILIKSEYFIKNKFEIVHCHFGPVAQELLFLKDILPDIKLITTFHGYDISSYLKWQNESIYSELLKRGDLFLPISEYWKSRLIHLGAPSERIRVHHMGIDLERFNDGLVKSKDGKNITLLSVGRLIEKKGHEWVLRALAKLVKEYPGIAYLIAGDGSLRGSLEDLTRTLSLEGHVKFLGPVTQAQALELYRRADIFVLTSVTAKDGDQEGIPVSIMEAMATELPVVSTFHTGIPELVEDGKAGHLVAERDVEALKNKLELLLRDQQLRHDMGKRGRKIVAEKFNQDILDKELDRYYRDIKVQK